MTTIKEKILEVKKKILAEVDSDDKSFSEGVQDKAIAAILKGPGSTEWETYMKMFVDPTKPEQLKRLTGTDATKGDKDFDRLRAYLVSDGPCTPITALNFGRFSMNRLDDDLDKPAPEPQ